MTVQYDIVGSNTTRNGIGRSEIHRLWNIVNGTDGYSLVHLSAQLHHRFFAHTIYNHVSPTVAQYAWSYLVLPIVVMSESAQRGFDTAKHYRHVGI